MKLSCFFNLIPTQNPPFETNLSLQYLQTKVAGLRGFINLHPPTQLVSPDNFTFKRGITG